MMKSVLIAVVSAVQAYLLGSIDTGILVSKFLYHDDVRKYGCAPSVKRQRHLPLLVMCSRACWPCASAAGCSP